MARGSACHHDRTRHTIATATAHDPSGTAYCDRLEAHLAATDPDAPETESAHAWLVRARVYTESGDPFQTLPSMPDPPEFGPDDLQPFLEGWSTHGPGPPSRR